jgi:two-component system, chemotaxis family, protein-glutamate methylesterase/glutaminase
MGTTTLLPKHEFYYIGIGASAGGQEALCEFFSHLPADLPAAYFVVTHLSRFHKSRLFEIIRRRTKMPVITVEHAMPVEVGKVYFLVENTVMTFDQNGVVVQHRIEWQMINRAVDALFSSMAMHHGPRVIGIILSGGGDDGAAGAVEIAKQGGLVLVQEPSTARFDRMPAAAIEKDHPAAVLPLAALAKHLATLMTRRNALKDHFLSNFGNLFGKLLQLHVTVVFYNPICDGENVFFN